MKIVFRFWKYTKPTRTCWEWIGHKSGDGYGVIVHKGKNEKAHRLSWTLFIGDVPKGLCVLHKCDNRGCVNPGHLFLGTSSDNTADMVKKGRQAVGLRNARSKLSEQQIREIRYLGSLGETQASIARKFGVGSGYISRIINKVRRISGNSEAIN